MLIAIDGPSGSGKSTIARGIGQRLGLDVLDTGAMYRAVTLAVLRAGIDPSDGTACTQIAQRCSIEVTERVLLDGEDVTAEIRGPQVTAAVSTVSAHAEVRALLVERQRAWATERGGGVVEGRDIGTVVFPTATLKVFLSASDDERARRRQRDEADADRHVEVEELRDALNRRDHLDSNRSVSPLVAAPDALVIDTTQRSAQDVIEAIVEQLPARTEGSGALRFYTVARGALVALGRILFRLRVIGRDRVPSEGPYIVAPTHRSGLDIPFAAAVTRRRIRFLAKKEVLEGFLSGPILRALGGISVARGTTDRAALRACQEALEAGEPIAVFPEGTRSFGTTLSHLHDGAAYLALKACVPIVPVGIGGSEQILPRGRVFPRPHRVVVVVGEPLRGAPGASARRRADVSELTERLCEELQSCFTQAQEAAGSSR